MPRIVVEPEDGAGFPCVAPILRAYQSGAHPLMRHGFAAAFATPAMPRFFLPSALMTRTPLVCCEKEPGSERDAHSPAKIPRAKRPKTRGGGND
mgnify:CR=1 FL=1